MGAGVCVWESRACRGGLGGKYASYQSWATKKAATAVGLLCKGKEMVGRERFRELCGNWPYNMDMGGFSREQLVTCNEGNDRNTYQPKAPFPADCSFEFIPLLVAVHSLERLDLSNIHRIRSTNTIAVFVAVEPVVTRFTSIQVSCLECNNGGSL